MPCKKQRYLTRAEAKRDVKRINAQHVLRYPLTNVYYHTECGYWHATSMSKEASRTITRKLKK